MIIHLKNIDIDIERMEESYDYDEGVLILFDTGSSIRAVFLQEEDAEAIRAWFSTDSDWTSDGPADWSYINDMIAKNR